MILEEFVLFIQPNEMDKIRSIMKCEKKAFFYSANFLICSKS